MAMLARQYEPILATAGLDADMARPTRPFERGCTASLSSLDIVGSRHVGAKELKYDDAKKFLRVKWAAAGFAALRNWWRGIFRG
jgi:hypothetical protein